MNKGFYILSFLCGAIVGAAAMAIYKDKKAEESVVVGDETVTNEDNTEEVQDDEEATYADYVEVITDNEYSKGEDIVHSKPYFLEDPTDAGAYEDYDYVTLTLFADGTLVDDQYEIMTDTQIAHHVGRDYASYFGRYDDDDSTVYIRNDDLCCDYEIVKDLRNYAEMDEHKPHLKWRENE